MSGPDEVGQLAAPDAPVAYLAKDALFAARLPEEDVAVPGVGVVRIRALTRTQALSIQGKAMPPDEMERLLLESALVTPALTKGEVRLWQDASPAGELEPVTNAIMRLSGMAQESAKEAVKTFRD